MAHRAGALRRGQRACRRGVSGDSTHDAGGDGRTGGGRMKAQAVARAKTTGKVMARPKASEGWQGWDEYAAFYDWENAQTIGRADIAFWRDFAGRVNGRTLELGCGTGRLLVPIARSGVEIVGIDRSASMLAYA